MLVVDALGPVGETSLVDGPVPVVVYVLAALLLVFAAWRRGRRRWVRVLALAVVAGVTVALGVRWLVAARGWSSEPVPLAVSVPVAGTAAALVLAVAGWRGAGAWRRVGAVLAVPVLALSTALAVDHWTGYVPTVGEGWEVATGEGVPGAVTPDRLPALRGTAQPRGRLVAVDIPAARSGFAHRTEYVWLPPRWFDGPTPPTLPAVLLVGGAFAAPEDWTRVGRADRAVAEHGGDAAPVLVMADSGGSFDTDTECVDGPRGNAATHLTVDVPGYVEQTFGVSADPAAWAVAGWSTGGTCAIDMVAMHPELFHTFLDISGDTGPNSGGPDQTLADLYGGDRAAMARFDPATVLATHGTYTGVEGIMEESVDDDGAAVDYLAGPGRLPEGVASVGAADVLAPRARAVGIPTLVIRRSMGHTWQFAQRAFAEAVPWLCGRVGVPGAPVVPLEQAAGGRTVLRG